MDSVQQQSINTPTATPSARFRQRLAVLTPQKNSTRTTSNTKLQSIRKHTKTKVRKRLRIDSPPPPLPPPPPPLLTSVAASLSVSLAVFDWHEIFDRLFREHNLYVEKENAFVLGTGSFGVVIRAWNGNRNVSVKITRQSQHQQPFGDHNFVSFEHPNLVRVFDYKRLNNRYSITVMELLEDRVKNRGVNVKNLEQFCLHETVASGDTRTKIGFAIDVTRALAYCHSKRTLHLDIKASNVLVVCDDRYRFVCKLCDFGSSIAIDNIRDNLVYKTTISHTAPELLSGQRPNEKCDIYSLAVTMWQIQYECSYVPYQGIANDTVIYNVVKNNWRPSTGSETQPIVCLPFELCWQPEPDKRPDSIEILQQLQQLIKLV